MLGKRTLMISTNRGPTGYSHSVRPTSESSQSHGRSAFSNGLLDDRLGKTRETRVIGTVYRQGYRSYIHVEETPGSTHGS